MSEPIAHDKDKVHSRVIARLKEQAEDIRRLASGLGEELLAKRTVPDKWSLKELLCHLTRIQQVFEGRVEAMLARDNPAIASYEPEGDPEFDRMAARPTEQTLAEFTAGRDRLAARLKKLRPPDWHRPGTHPEFPHYDVHFAVEYMAHHEAHHIYQIYQRRSPFGPVPH